MKKPKRFETVAAASRETGVSPASLRRWRDDEKIDVLDPRALAKRIAMKQQRIDGPNAKPSGTGESYSEARRRREVAAANRMEIAAKREAGEVMARADAMAAGEKIGFAFRSLLNRSIGILPGELCGLDSPKIQKKLKDHFHGLLTELSNLDSAEILPPDFADLDKPPTHRRILPGTSATDP